MTRNLFTLLTMCFLFACGEQKDDTSDPADTAEPTIDEPSTEPPPAPTIPECLTETGTTLSGFVGRLDIEGQGNVYVAEERTVAVYPVLSEEDTVFIEGNYIGFGIAEDIEPLYTTQSDSEGCYSSMIPPGEYSIVSSIGDGWFCEGSDEFEAICFANLEPSEILNFVWDNTVMY